MLIIFIRFVADDAGTHLYHSHSGSQRAEGLFGAIIVRQKNDLHFNSYDYDLPDHYIILNDWFNQNTMESKFTTFVHDRKSKANPDAILINGKGYQKESSSKATPKAIFKVKYGSKYRFRLISAGIIACPIQFSIENHTFKVISSDGQPFREETLEAIVIHAGFK